MSNLLANNHARIGNFFEFLLFVSSLIAMSFVAIAIYSPSMADIYLKDVAFGMLIWGFCVMVFMSFSILAKEFYFIKELNA